MASNWSSSDLYPLSFFLAALAAFGGFAAVLVFFLGGGEASNSESVSSLAFFLGGGEGANSESDPDWFLTGDAIGRRNISLNYYKN